MKLVGKIIGSIACALLFAGIGFFSGLLFGWQDSSHDGYASTNPKRNETNN